MNLFALQAQIIDTRKYTTQTLKDVAIFQLQFPSWDGKEINQIKAEYWGERGMKAFDSLKIGQWCVFVGNLRIVKVGHGSGNTKFFEITPKIILSKVTPIKKKAMNG